MSLLTRLLPAFQSYLPRYTIFTGRFFQPVSNFNTLTNTNSSPCNPGGLFNMSVRTVIRNHFPRPSERRRIKRHGWFTRMKTAPGRRVIMNRILKGRHVYTH
ncbi:hypothetical protein JTB14_001459 [Gonioctena quinquepunctata]|nr:hypothetical protein JTB14_001459 [Gonioctena quinquepunctata]